MTNDANGRPPNGRSAPAGSNRSSAKPKPKRNQGDLWSDEPSLADEPSLTEAAGTATPAATAGTNGGASKRRQQVQRQTETTPAGNGARSGAFARRSAGEADEGAFLGTPLLQELPAPPAPLQPSPVSADILEDAVYGDYDLYRDYDRVYDEDEVYEPDEYAFLRNPYVLAAIAVGMAILLAVFVVIFLGKGNDVTTGSNDNNGAVVVPGSQTPASDNVPSGGFTAKSIANATVREGPSLEYLELGLLRNGQDVQVTGRNNESSWVQIVFPSGSQLRGWVPDSALKLPDNASSLLAVVQVTPIQRPTVVIPTPTPRPADPTQEPTSTTEAGGEVDIGVVIASECTQNTEVVLLVTNTGKQDVVDQPVRVSVTNNGNVEFEQTLKATLKAGQAAQLRTGVKAQPPSITATVIMDGLKDTNASNNIARCNVASGGGNPNGNNVPPPVDTPQNRN